MLILLQTGDKVISGISDRLSKIEDILRPLPPLEEKTRKAIDAGADVIQKERIKEVESKNPGVGLIAAPREERKQAAAILVSSKKDYCPELVVF